MRWLYNLTFFLLTPIFITWLLLRSIRNANYRRRWSERFGYVPRLPMRQRCLWVHAVSVGEVQAASPLIQALLDDYPEYQIIVTTMTPTGSDQLQKVFAHELNKRLLHYYVPVDIAGSVKRFMRRLRPELGVIIETELWPNLIHYAKARGTRLILASARLSERSVRGYLKVPGPSLIRYTLESIDAIAAQSHADARRLRALGAPETRMHVLGNLKFDFKLPKGVRERAADWRQQVGKRPVWIAASTHAGEEEAVLSAHQALLAQWPNLLCVLVPRHPERFTSIVELAHVRFNVVTRSSGAPVLADTQIYVLDSMGELNDFYAASDVAFVAGSLVPTGGHNLLEPAALGLPVVVGPHTFNCEDIAENMLACDAAVRVNDAEELAAAVERFFVEPVVGRKTGQNGQDLIKRNRGTLQNLTTLIAEVMAKD